MDYKKAYENLISSRKSRIREKGVVYEQHHIVMRSMGGSNDPDNLVLLTPREHFLAHWLLWRIHTDKKTALAFTLCALGILVIISEKFLLRENTLKLEKRLFCQTVVNNIGDSIQQTSSCRSNH